ncbi:MAG: ABC transporter permease [Candidatus Saganbacteria bacterium]|nr:ABC transporter permease [Candidatus Saganbacteria bacterium]
MINLFEPLKIAFASLLVNRTRSLLTTLGVIIGVAAVITLVSMGEGAKSFILDQIRGWGAGTNFISVNPGEADAAVPELTLTIGDANAIKTQVKNVRYVMPEVVGRGRLRYGKKEYTPPFTLGMTEDFPYAYTQKVAEGRFFNKAEIDGRKHVVVIGKNTARKLFGEYSPLGERIKINGVGFIVIGVLEEKGTLLFYDMDDIAYLPISLTEAVLGTKTVTDLNVVVIDEASVPQAVTDITRLMTRRHGKQDFQVFTQQGGIDMINNILNALTGIVSAIAAISLLVGGIGIMNIMLVAVTERTREIGIRKAIGAKRQDIFLQFVMESVLITMSGALIGIAVGTLAAWGIMTWLKMSAVIAWGAAYLACLVAFLVGTFFGVYPAMRAARLDPVEALRFEV